MAWQWGSGVRTACQKEQIDTIMTSQRCCAMRSALRCRARSVRSVHQFTDRQRMSQEPRARNVATGATKAPRGDGRQ